LHPNQVQTYAVREYRLLNDRFRLPSIRCQKASEPQLVPKVAHTASQKHLWFMLAENVPFE
jgi:hypothetical protein